MKGHQERGRCGVRGDIRGGEDSTIDSCALGSVMKMLSGIDAAERIGKAIEEKARRVMDSEHAVRKIAEDRPAPEYRLVLWVCSHCHRPYRYSCTLAEWVCLCKNMSS